MNEKSGGVVQQPPKQKVDPTQTLQLRKIGDSLIKQMVNQLKADAKRILLTIADIQKKNKELERLERNIVVEYDDEVSRAFVQIPKTLPVGTQLQIKDLLEKSYQKGSDQSNKELQQIGQTDGAIPTTQGDRRVVSVLVSNSLDLITNLRHDYLTQAKRLIRDGILGNQRFPAIAKQISDLTATTISKGMMQIRTEVVRAFNASAQMRYRQVGVQWKMWQSSRSPTTSGGSKKGTKTCPICDALHGRVVKTGDAFATYRGSEVRHPPIHPNCFIKPSTPIFTSKGQKRIDQIRIGDLVLTHKGRFRRVVRLLEGVNDWTGKTVTLRYHLNNSEHLQTIEVTEEHPIFIKRGSRLRWVKAINLRETDLIGLMMRTCEICDTLMDVHKETCSRSCATMSQWNKKILSHETHLRSLTTRYNNSSLEQRREWTKAARDKAPLSGKVVPQKYKTRETSLEKQMRKLLESEKIPFEKQKWLNYEGKTYRVDFALKDARIIVEVDGSYWHNREDRRVKDEERDQLLERNGWKVLRYTDVNLRVRARECIDEIKRVLANDHHHYSIKWIKIQSLRIKNVVVPKRLWNFAVEEDESYVANNVTVSNCRCTIRPASPETVKESRVTPTPSIKGIVFKPYMKDAPEKVAG